MSLDRDANQAGQDADKLAEIAAQDSAAQEANPAYDPSSTSESTDFVLVGNDQDAPRTAPKTSLAVTAPTATAAAVLGMATQSQGGGAPKQDAPKQDAVDPDLEAFKAFVKSDMGDQCPDDAALEGLYQYAKDHRPEQLKEILAGIALDQSGAGGAAAIQIVENAAHRVQNIMATAPIAQPAIEGPVLDLTATDVTDQAAIAAEAKTDDKEVETPEALAAAGFLAEWYKKFLNKNVEAEAIKQIVQVMKEVDTPLYNAIAKTDPATITDDRANPTVIDRSLLQHYYKHVDPDRIAFIKVGQPILKGGVISTLGKAVNPTTVGIATALVMRQVTNYGISAFMLAGGPLAYAAAGGAGFVTGAVAESAKLHFRAQDFKKNNPDLAEGLSNQQCIQLVLKSEEKQKLLTKLQKVEDKLAAKTESYAQDREKLEAKLESLSAGGGQAMRAKWTRDLKNLDKTLESLAKQKNTLSEKLDAVENKDPASYSIRGHLLKAGLLAGAISAVTLGAANNIETLSAGFNAVSGAAAQGLENIGLGFVNTAIADAAGVVTETITTTIQSGQEIVAGLLGQEDVIVAAPAVDPAADAYRPADAAVEPVMVNPSDADGAVGVIPGPIDVQTGLNLSNPSPEILALAQELRESGIRVTPSDQVQAALSLQFGGTNNIPEKFAPYIANLTSSVESVRAEAQHSIAHLLIENNTEFAKAGHKELASSIMLGNIFEHGHNTNMAGLERSWDGLRWLQPDAATIVAGINDVDLQQVRSFAAPAQAAAVAAVTEGQPSVVRNPTPIRRGLS